MDTKVVGFLKSKNLSVMPEDIGQKLEVWRAWYRGRVDSFHNYKLYQGKKKINAERKSLGMAARAAQRWADLLLNEKVEIRTDDEYTGQRLEALLRSVNFYVRGNNLVEAAFAVGGGFLIQYWDGKKLSPYDIR